MTTRTCSRRRPILLALAVLALRATSSTAQVPAGEPARFLERYVKLTPSEIEQARTGTVVTKVLESTDPDEVALFGIVAIDAARTDVVQRVRDLPAFLRTPGRTGFGLFGMPATLADVQSFSVDPSDLDAIRKCKPGSCDVKMPAASFDEFGRAVNWSASSSADQVNALVRQRMVGYVERYRKGGTAAMVEYADGKTARRASDIYASLLAESPYLFEYLPAFHQYLRSYPATPLADVTDAVFWTTDRMPSLRPILGISHVSIYTPAGAPMALVSVKQLYASHYFVGAFALTTILDRTDAPGGRGVYYMTVQRLRFDHLPSGGLLNIRGRVIGRMHDALSVELAQRKASLERR